MVAPLISNAATVRVTRVDGCGRPVCGDDGAFVTDCFASVSMEANIEEGEDITFTAANGRQCGFKKGCPTFNGFNLTFTFFQASPELMEIMTGSPVFFDWDGQPIGFDSCSISCRAGFALEVWTDVLGTDVCPEEDTGDGAWVYFLLPWVTNGIIGDLELANEAVNLSLTGATRAGSTCPRTASTRLISSMAWVKSPVISFSAASIKLPSECPARPSPLVKRCCSSGRTGAAIVAHVR